MDFGVALTFSGVVFVVGTAIASRSGDPTLDYRNLFIAGGSLIALGVLACIASTWPERFRDRPTKRVDRELRLAAIWFIGSLMLTAGFLALLGGVVWAAINGDWPPEPFDIIITACIGFGGAMMKLAAPKD